MLRTLGVIVVMMACCAAATVVPVRVQSWAVETGPAAKSRTGLATPTEFADLVKSDPLEALAASIEVYDRRITHLRAKFCKQERIGGKLLPAEVIRVAFRDDPFAVSMVWQKGGGTASATLYVRGEHDGQMLAKLPLVGAKRIDPRGVMPRLSARYTIEEFGLVQASRRTLKAWTASRNRGELKTEYLGLQPVAELDGRLCHVIRRHCPNDEIDAFAPGDPTEVNDKNRADAFRSVTIYFDAETLLHTGTVLTRSDGELAGAYWFREFEANPKLPPNQFTPAGW